MFNINIEEVLKKDDFNSRVYMEKILSEFIKGEGTPTDSAFLDQLQQSLTMKKGKCEESLSKLSSVKSNLKMERKIQMRQAEKGMVALESEKLNLAQSLNGIREELNSDMTNILNVKKKVDKLYEEKEAIMDELFVLDLAKEMKLNHGRAEKLKELPDKIRFSRSLSKVEGYINLYEKDLIPHLEKLVTNVEKEFLDKFNEELELMQYQYSGDILIHFFNVNREEHVFYPLLQTHVLRIDFKNIGSAFGKDDGNLKNILDNFVSLAISFYERGLLITEHVIKLFTEDQFFKLTNYFFESYLKRYLNKILDSNLQKKNDQFFLEHLDRIHSTFAKLSSRFSELKNLSVYFHDLFLGSRSALLEGYLEQYFKVEERFFGKRHHMYAQVFKDKLSQALNEGGLNFALNLFGGEKLEEYLGFVKKSIIRCAGLSRGSFSHFQVSRLVSMSLTSFKDFFKDVLLTLKEYIESKNRFGPEAFRLIEFLNVFLLRMNINQKNYVSYLKASNYFSEIDSLRKETLKFLRDILIQFVNVICDHIFIGLRSLPKSKKFKKGPEKLFGKYKAIVEPFLKEIRTLGNAETLCDIEVGFHTRYLDLLEERLFSLDKKKRDKLDYVEEFRQFFESFSDVKRTELIGSITAFKYLLLSLKSQDLDLDKFAQDTSGERIDLTRIEKYKSLLADK